MTAHDPIDGKTRVARHRAAMRAKGYRLKQFWVPDTSSPKFREMARHEARMIASSRIEAEDQAWVDAASISLWDEEPGKGSFQGG